MPAQLGDRNALLHGGAAARRALTTGAEFTGPAREAELAVINELATDGRVSIMERLAVRLTAACDLYYNAVLDAANRGDERSYHSYLKSFGWLASKSLAAWALVGREQDNDDSLDYEAILRQEQQSNAD